MSRHRMSAVVLISPGWRYKCDGMHRDEAVESDNSHARMLTLILTIFSYTLNTNENNALN